MKKWIAILLVTVCAGLAAWALAVWWGLSDHFPHDKLSRLVTSMGTNEVQKILGPPQNDLVRTNKQAQPYLVWTYRAGAFVSVYIDFDPQGHFQRHRTED